MDNANWNLGPEALAQEPIYPLYWMYEVTGKMKDIILKFLDEQKRQNMTDPEKEILRWYVWQWVACMPTKPLDYDRIKTMDMNVLSEYIWNELLDYGIDPL